MITGMTIAMILKEIKMNMFKSFKEVYSFKQIFVWTLLLTYLKFIQDSEDCKV